MSELYQLPDGWEWKKLGDVCNLLNGYAFKANEYVEYSDTVIIRMGNIRPNGGFDAEHKIQYLPNKYAKELPNYILNDGDLIIAMTDMATEMRILGIPTLVGNTNGRTFMLNQRVGKLYDFKLDKIKIEYLRYILSTNQIKDYYKSLGGGGLQINIGKQQILSVRIPLPALPEQQRIVAKLDALFEKIDKAIALHVKNMEEADGFMASVLNEVFSELEEKYEKITFDKVCKKITDGSHNPPQGIENSEYIMLSSKNIFNGLINFDNPRYLSEKDFNIENKRTDIEMGDVLLTIVGTIGRTAVVDFIKKFTLQRSVAVLKPNRDILNSYFLMYSLQKNLDVLVNGAQGAAQKGIYLNSVKKLEIVNAPISLQQKIVTYLDDISFKIEHVKKVQKEKMESLKALKASILDSAFRGEL